MRMTLAATGPVPAAEAWDRYARPDRWPTWSPQLSRVEPAGAVLAAGLTGRVYAPLGISAGFTVTAVDAAARTWRWEVRRGPLRLRLEHGVQPAGDGSLTWLVLWGPAPVLLGYAPLASYALHRLVTLPR
ncbi:MAG TPA: SRPBCC family protein [Mycobacteriales bacterium]